MKSADVVVDDLHLWLPGRGQVLGTSTAGVSLTMRGLTLLTGRSGSGTSVLLAAVAGRLPAGAAIAGDVRGVDSPVTVPEFLPDVPVRDLRGAHPDLALLDAVDVSPDSLANSGVRTGQLDESTRAVLALAWAMAQRPRLLLADQPLARLRAEHRAPAVAALRRCADEGATVVVAEHVLEDLVPVADSVVELVRGQVLASPAATWNPRTLPLTPGLAAARALGLPRTSWCDPAAVSAIESARLATPGGTPGRGPGDVIARTDPAESRLAARLDLHRHETIGVVGVPGADHRAHDVARRLTALANGRRTLPHPLVLPPGVKVAKLLKAWERRHRDATPILDSRLLSPGLRPVPLDGARTTDAHSAGELAALRHAMLTSVPGAALLIHPERGLDAASRRAMASELHDHAPAPRVVISHDVEFLVRACHRLVILDADGGEEVGTPALLGDRLPAMPALRRAGLRVHRVRDLVPADAREFTAREGAFRG